ncbi:MAG: hypothetical protein A2V88_04405 [Elusimicrobia bacterium RBG_16_66_12]|nr:MAG: hypothetical protein A2V88_04405 [Elusimicrobia bacterium RBG_16_66_12]
MIEDIFPASEAKIFSHDVRRFGVGEKFRPCLELWSFRAAGVPGVLRNVTLAFRRRGSAPAGATVTLQVIALGSDADQVTIFSSLGIHVATYTPTSPWGIPFPVDDSGPWVLWVGSVAAAAAAQASFQIAYHPFDMIGC